VQEFKKRWQEYSRLIGSSEEDGARLSSVVINERRKGNGGRLKNKEFHLKIRWVFCFVLVCFFFFL